MVCPTGPCGFHFGIGIVLGSSHAYPESHDISNGRVQEQGHRLPLVKEGQAVVHLSHARLSSLSITLYPGGNRSRQTRRSNEKATALTLARPEAPQRPCQLHGLPEASRFLVLHQHYAVCGLISQKLES